jgi:2-methylcitrate dehydratase PrpD
MSQTTDRESGATTQVESTTARLAAFAAELRFEDLPPEVVDHVGRLVLDTLGCALGGSQNELGTIAATYARAEATGGGSASVAGVDGLASPRVAAEANGRMAGSMDADDTFPSAGQTSHHGGSTVAVALALAEGTGRGGKELITAIAAGYEVGARFGVSVPLHEASPGEKRSGAFRVGGGPAGVLGAATAAASVLRLDADRTAHALGIVGAHVDAPPAKWFEGRVAPMVKSMDLGWTAAAGVTAGSLAQLGMTGYEDILDGQFGLWRVLGYDDFDFDLAGADLGGRWHMLDSAFKRYPCQYWMQSALRALECLLDEHRIAPEEIESILLRTNPRSNAPRFHDTEPEGAITGEFNFPHAAAMLALRVPPGPRWLDPGTLADPRVPTLREKVSVEIDPRSERLGDFAVDGVIRKVPAGAVVHAREASFEASADAGVAGQAARGAAALDEELRAKLATMLEPLASHDPRWDARAGEIADLVGGLAQVPDARAVGALLRPPTGGE